MTRALGIKNAMGPFGTIGFRARDLGEPPQFTRNDIRFLMPCVYRKPTPGRSGDEVRQGSRVT